jgi:hypothetical protein
MKRVIFLRPAEEEMTEAAAFYASRAEHLGSLFLFRIAVAVRQIGRNPQACPVIRTDIRRKLVAQFPYGVPILFGTQFAPARRNILQITHFTPCARLNKML